MFIQACVILTHTKKSQIYTDRRVASLGDPSLHHSVSSCYPKSIFKLTCGLSSHLSICFDWRKFTFPSLMLMCGFMGQILTLQKSQLNICHNRASSLRLLSVLCLSSYFLQLMNRSFLVSAHTDSGLFRKGSQ